MPSGSLIDREFLEKLERLTLLWRNSFPGLVGGHNTSRFGGPGQEFLDHRHFHAGDDLRGVNWRAYLRFEKLFMKMFHIEPRVPVRMLLDVSASMGTGGGRKLDYGKRLSASLAYVGLVRLESVTLLTFSDRLGDPISCTGGRHRLGPVADALNTFEAGGLTDYLALVRQFSSRYLQRGLLVIVSDFLADISCEKQLQYLSDFGHELILIQLWDEEDRFPPWRGELQVVDSETGDESEIDFDARAGERYTAAFDTHSRALERIAVGSGGRYVGLSTSVPIEEAIFGPLTSVLGVQ